LHHLDVGEAVRLGILADQSGVRWNWLKGDDPPELADEPCGEHRQKADVGANVKHRHARPEDRLEALLESRLVRPE
jgi:hypothetical protein